MMHRFYLHPIPQLGTFELPEAEARHAATVMRLRQGERLCIFDGEGNEGLAEIVTLARRSVVCTLLEPFKQVDRERYPAVHLGVALPKGDRERMLIEKAVELGAASLTPLITRRSVVQPDERSLERMRRTVLESSKQCGRNRLMPIHSPSQFESFLATDREGERWIAHPGTAKLTQVPQQLPRTVLVGPEGGFTDEEVLMATERGWISKDLGPRILRVETAVALLLAQP